MFSVRFFLLKTVFISVSPCYQNYTLSHISTKFQTYTEIVEIKGSVQQKWSQEYILAFCFHCFCIWLKQRKEYLIKLPELKKKLLKLSIHRGANFNSIFFRGSLFMKLRYNSFKYYLPTSCQIKLWNFLLQLEMTWKCL